MEEKQIWRKLFSWAEDLEIVCGGTKHQNQEGSKDRGQEPGPERPGLPGVAAWLWGPRHPADGFATMWRGFSPLVKWRRARGIKASLRTGRTPQSVAAVCRGRGEAAGGRAWGSGVPGSSGAHRAPPVSGWRLRGWRGAPPLWGGTPALRGPGGPPLGHGRGASDRRAGHPPLLERQRGGAIAALDGGRISPRGRRPTTGRRRRRPASQTRLDFNTFLYSSLSAGHACAHLRLGDGERRRRGGEGERRLRGGEGERLFLETKT